MEETRFSYLFGRYINQTITQAERKEFLILADQEVMQEELALLVEKEMLNGSRVHTLDTGEKQNILKNIYQIAEAEERAGKVISIRSFLRRKSAIAAAIVISIGVGLYVYSSRSRERIAYTHDVNFTHDIKPGTNSATLTLANGKKIVLNNTANGMVVEQGGTDVIKTDNGQITYQPDGNTLAGESQINTLSTARGERYMVRLPDGTNVMLNAASSLKYPVSFASLKSRKVELIGEAYFEVAKDEKRPFVVKTNDQDVEVLGTHFNIRSYPNETEIRTTLLEGSVRVGLWDAVNAKQITEKLLKPGEQSLTRLNSQSIEVQKADVQQVMGWKNGDFIFRRASLDEIMNELSRWYDIEVEYAPGIKTNRTYSGLISRSKNLSAVLRMLKSTGQINFEIEGKKIKVL